MNAYDRVTQALETHGCAHRGHDWVCPSHVDKDPSLSVTEGEAGVIMHCHAGCSVEEVVRSLNLEMADLFNEKPKTNKREIIATYDYEDENHNLLFQVVRFSPKDFRQRRPDPSKKDGWNWSLAGVRRVLYKMPFAGGMRGATVYLTEGEKDAEALLDRNCYATCNPGGAGKWRDEYNEALRGAHVIQVVDRDDAGFKHARLVRDSLAGVVASHEFVGAKEGKDAYDHFAKGYNADEFVPIVIDDDPDVGVFEGAETEQPAPANPMWAKLLSTNAIDDLPSPEYLIEDLITSDAVTVIYGMPGSMKSFLAIAMSLAVANNKAMFTKKVQGGDVLYVVAEGMATFKDRKKAWQIEHDVPDPDGVTWYPEPVNLLDEAEIEHLIEVADALQPVMIVVDTLSQCMPGADENSSIAMTTAIGNLERLRRATRAAIVVIHHTPKDGSSPRGHSSLMGAMWGGIKMSVTDGDIKLEVEKMKHDEKDSFVMRLRKVDVPGSKKGSAVLYLPTQVADSTDALFSDIELLNVLRASCGPEGMATTTLLRISGMAESTFHRVKNRLLMTGRIQNVGTVRQPRWAAVSDISGS